jgi:hypothetical protein
MDVVFKQWRSVISRGANYMLIHGSAKRLMSQAMIENVQAVMPEYLHC